MKPNEIIEDMLKNENNSAAQESTCSTDESPNLAKSNFLHFSPHTNSSQDCTSDPAYSHYQTQHDLSSSLPDLC